MLWDSHQPDVPALRWTSRIPHATFQSLSHAASHCVQPESNNHLFENIHYLRACFPLSAFSGWRKIDILSSHHESLCNVWYFFLYFNWLKSESILNFSNFFSLQLGRLLDKISCGDALWKNRIPCYNRGE